MIKLDSNENPFGASPLAVQAMQAALADCGSYPDDNTSALRGKLSKLHGVSEEQILITSGLTELLSMIGRTFLATGAHGLSSISSERSFIVYRIATEATNARFIEVPTLRDGFDLKGIAAAIDHTTRIVFLANPNNPTGTVVTAHEVDQFLKSVPENVVVVLDEAYYEFAAAFAGRRGIEYSHSLDYLRQGRNVIVLRTFSKVHGLAGARIGYGIASARVVESVTRHRALYSVSSLAQAGALAALDDNEHVRKAVENNTAQSERLVPAVAELGYKVTLPWANFLYCELGQDAAKFSQRLQHEGIAVRALGQWGASEAIRITIGTPDQNDALLKAMQKLRNL